FSEQPSASCSVAWVCAQSQPRKSPSSMRASRKPPPSTASTWGLSSPNVIPAALACPRRARSSGVSGAFAMEPFVAHRTGGTTTRGRLRAAHRLKLVATGGRVAVFEEEVAHDGTHGREVPTVRHLRQRLPLQADRAEQGGDVPALSHLPARC